MTEDRGLKDLMRDDELLQNKTAGVVVKWLNSQTNNTAVD